MNTIKTFFQFVRAIFSIFPQIVSLLRHQTYACILKIIVSTSQNNFNKSIKITGENSVVSTLTSNKDSFTHIHVNKHHKNPQTPTTS